MMFHSRVAALCLLAVLGAAKVAGAADTVPANQEAAQVPVPKVLYIVPWKPVAAPAVTLPPPQASFEGFPAPLDRGEFRRELRLRAATRPAAVRAPAAE